MTKIRLPPNTDFTGLPEQLINRLTKPVVRFLRIEAAGGAVLLLATLLALGLSNSPWALTYEELWKTPLALHIGPAEYGRSAREWINDGLMTLFFFLVAIELKRELVLGELRAPRAAALSIAGALGGMIAPASIYLLLQWGQPAEHGWGTVMATDTAFVVGVLALLGTRIPHSLRIFMLSLAIVDDIGAILVVAIAYTSDVSWSAVALAGLGVACVVGMARAGIRGFPLYFLIGGCTWVAVDASGIHGTVAGVILGLLTPARRWVNPQRLYGILGQVIAHPETDSGSKATPDRDSLQVAEVAARESLSPVERLEIALHPWVGFIIIPLFALANAGLPLSFEDLEHSVSVAVIAGLVIGKPVGIFAFTWLAVRTGVAARPAELDWKLMAGAGLLAGIGFTMSLFIAELAFVSSLVDSAKFGVFSASALSALMGVILLLWASASKVEHSVHPRRHIRLRRQQDYARQHADAPTNLE